MSRWAKIGVVTVSFLVVVYAALGFALWGQTSGDDRAYRSLIVFSEVLHKIQSDWVEQPNLHLVTSGAMHGLLEALDPYSAYLSPREYAEFKSKLQENHEGRAGAALSKRLGYIIVLSVLPDSGAHRAGLRSGDILESIAGFTTREMSIGQADLLLAGEVGTTVRVNVVRRGRSEQFELDVIRREVSSPKLIAKKLEGDIAYLGVPALDAGKAQQIRRQLAEFERQGLRKLVLDLRDCAGGEMQEGVETARLFLNAGPIASLRGQTVTRQDFAADPARVAWKHPLTVLISGGTSGPAELVAAGITANQRGEVVGERTFGSASEQKLIHLEDGAAVFLTVANFYTPAGKSIPESGIAPTIEAAASRDDLADAGDLAPLPNPFLDVPAMKKAIETLLPRQTRQRDADARRTAQQCTERAARPAGRAA